MNDTGVEAMVPVPLSTRAVAGWGSLGGLCVVLVTNGVFDREVIQQMTNGSGPWAQLGTLGIVSVITAVAGGVWATLHKPLYTAMLAFQLGVIAPGAFHALIGATNVSAADLNVRLDGLLLSSAYAQFQQTSEPTTVECIVKAIIKRPC